MRTFFAICIALLINLLLFLVMERMANNRLSGLFGDEETLSLDFVRVKDLKPTPPPPPKRREKPPEPEQKEKTEKPQVIQQIQVQRPTPPPLATESIALNLPVSIKGTPFLGNLELAPDGPVFSGQGKLSPVVHIPPQYPPRALMKKVEGFVVVEFTISKDGSTKDLKITKAKPPRIFNRAALRAVRRWRYEPQMTDGQLVEPRTTITINFELEKG